MKKFINKELIIIGNMISDGKIPSSDSFEINESHINQFMNYYDKLFGQGNGGLGKNTNKKFARKLAGLSLIKLNYSRGATFSVIKSGIIYLIKNDSYPDHYKIGMTIDLNSRLESYQTYDPYRAFKVVKYDFVLNRFISEKKILGHPGIFVENGEWILRDNAIKIFNMCITAG